MIGYPARYVAINQSETEIDRKERTNQNGIGERDVMTPPLLPVLSGQPCGSQ
jgi:hypothetical protein